MDDIIETLVIGAGQVVLTQLFAAVAGSTVQVATGVGPVVIGVGQVVRVKAFADVAEAAVHACTGTLAVLLVPQKMSSQPLLLDAVCGVQVATGTFVVVEVWQVVPT